MPSIFAGCSGTLEKPKPSTPPPTTDQTNNAPAPSNTTQLPPEPERSRYVQPEVLIIPQMTSDGIFYHHRFVQRLGQDDQPIRSAFPVGLQCPENENVCYFGLRNKVYKFSTNNLSHDEPLPVTVAADFSNELDGQNKQLANILVHGGYIYGLYDNYNLEFPEPGIVIRDEQGRFVDPYFLDSTMSCPNSFLAHEGEIWVTVSNCVGDNAFRSGTVFVLGQKIDGTLEEVHEPLATTQVNPQAMKEWRANDKTYILVVNTGHTTVRGETLSESSVNVIDPVTKKIVATILLGLAAANTITISGDQKVAILGSQNHPWLFGLNLERLLLELSFIDPKATSPAILWNVAFADATNPVLLSTDESAYISSVQYYDDATSTLLASSFNNTRLFQLKAEGPKFGEIVGHYLCGVTASENCGEIAPIEEGAITLTGQPAGVTFYPKSRLSR